LAAHAARLKHSKQPSNWDLVPLDADAFRRVREGIGITQGLARSMRLENRHGLPTPRIARQLVAALSAADSHGRFADDIAWMTTLASEDLAWDVIEAVEEIPPGEEVELFDVTVPGANSFLASGVVAHNCHIYTTTTGAMKNAFGGLLNTKRHYTHSWIHATLVDLLAIQKEI